jgi:LPXTG-site transpeptidase (sortase) family protein
MKIKDSIFFLLGCIFIITAIIVFLYSNPDILINYSPSSSVVDQEGFAPIFLPNSDGSLLEKLDQTTQSLNIPDRIIIPVIELDAPVVLADAIEVNVDGTDSVQFLVPEDFSAGWHDNSTPLGEIGNTVISGHHNAYGKVFENLVDLENGDEVILVSGDEEFTYKIARKLILREKDQPLSVRLENARWMLPSDDERITLITCWPKNSNSHRLVLVAIPTELFE